MPEEIEVETKDLQEAIQELHEEQAEEKKEAKELEWTRFIGLSTAIFAVFAALAALQAGALVNEAMIQQIKSSDKWNEYQSAKLKGHLYGLRVDELRSLKTEPTLLEKYGDTVEKEGKKSEELKPEAEKLEAEAEHLMHKHHQFSYAVTGIQVSIALGAVAALTRVKAVWFVSIAVGLVGLGLFCMGFL